MPQTPASTSTFKVPMKGDNGEDVAALSFGISCHKRRHPDEIISQERKRKLEDMSPTATEIKRSLALRSGTRGEANYYDEDWECQTKRVLDTFAELQNKILDEEDPKGSGNTSQYRNTLRVDDDSSMSSKLLWSAKQDLSTLMDFMKQTDDSAMFQPDTKEIKHEYRDNDKTSALLCKELLEPTNIDLQLEVDGAGPRNANRCSDASLLECHETLASCNGEEIQGGLLQETNDAFIAEATERSITKESSPVARAEDKSRGSNRTNVNDVALIRGLTRLIRRKALELSKRRLAKNKPDNASR
jgi:hypothetical protein